MAESKSDIPLAEMNIESNQLLSNNNEEPNVDASALTNDDVVLNLVDTSTTAAPNDIESYRLLSNCNEEQNEDVSSFTNDDVELPLVDTTTTAACEVKSTTDILACLETSDSQGLLFRIAVMITI